MQHITIYDFLLLPIYLFIFYVLVKRRSLRLENSELKKIFLVAFGLRMFGSIAYSLMVQYYYGYGDSFTYYMGGSFLVDQVKLDISNIKYLFYSADELQKIYTAENGAVGGVAGWIGISSSAAVMRVSAAVALLSFNKFLITSIFFGLFSFFGQWKLFQVFNDINKGKNQKLLAFAVLYTPAIWFWGSGLMKESICFGSLGFIISILYYAVVKKKWQWADWLLLAFFSYIIYITKSYIITILAISLSLTFLFNFFLRIRIILLRIILTILTLAILIFSLSLSNFTSQINDLAEESVSTIEIYQKNYQISQTEDENSRGGFEMVSNLAPSFNSMLLRSPVVILSCLYRPFLWESQKIIIFFSSLESTLFLLATLYMLFKSRVWGFFKMIFTDPYFFFCFMLTVLFAMIIGFTTYNFGTMTRYKIVLLPFAYFMLIQIYTIYQIKDQNKDSLTG